MGNDKKLDNLPVRTSFVSYVKVEGVSVDAESFIEEKSERMGAIRNGIRVRKGWGRKGRKVTHPWLEYQRPSWSRPK